VTGASFVRLATHSHSLAGQRDGRRAMVVVRNRLFGRGDDLFDSFVNGCRSLVLGDVECSYDLLLAFRGFDEVFFVLERFDRTDS
jgi:hypothetical protein